MSMEAICDRQDKLVRDTRDFPAIAGMGSLDRARLVPGPIIARFFGAAGREQRRVPGPGNGKLLCRNAAVGHCRDGRTRHIRSYNGPQQFLGFHYATEDPDRIVITSRGSVKLFVNGPVKVGDPVYCEDVDCFSVRQGAGAVEIGIILGLETDKAGYCIVAFKAYDDPRPLVPETFR
jgi:hypothetical protein